MKQCTHDGSVFIQWTENLNNKPLASDPLSMNLKELKEMCSNYASVVNVLDSGMNRVVRKKNTNEVLKRLRIYFVELKR
jgi:sialic acid synthase SpsE